jgi:hypothetical protein
MITLGALQGNRDLREAQYKKNQEQNLESESQFHGIIITSLHNGRASKLGTI